MKTYKRILAAVLCVALVLTLAPLSSFAGLELPSLFEFAESEVPVIYLGY